MNAGTNLPSKPIILTREIPVDEDGEVELMKWTGGSTKGEHGQLSYFQNEVDSSPRQGLELKVEVRLEESPRGKALLFPTMKEGWS